MNVLLAALRSRRDASHRLLRLVGDPRFRINLSVPLLLRVGRASGDLLPVAAGAARPEGRLRAGTGRRERVPLHRDLQFAGADKSGMAAISPQEFLREIEEIT
jgi:hypothetical protein